MPSTLNLNWRGTWSSGTTYNPGDVVFRNGSSWISTTTNTNIDPVTDAGANWNLVASAGAQGLPGSAGSAGTGSAGQSIRWLGDYNPSQSYAVNDAVGYSNSAFVCMFPTPAFTYPLTDPTNIHSAPNAPYWSRMALGQPLIWQGGRG